MKKRFLRAAIVILFGIPMIVPAYAASMEVTVIGGEDEESIEPVSLDDIKIDKDIEIDNYAVITPKEYKVQDALYAYRAGHNDNDMKVYLSGDTADYILLKVDITNIMTKAKDYLENCHVTVHFNDKYDYEGWQYQYNYDNVSRDQLWLGERNGDLDTGFKEIALDPKDCPIDNADQFSIGPMYDGHYVFGCTLPNKVVQGKEPLSMTIELDGNELTYNIRQ